jgi:CheY-like chemotaxis protein
MRGHILVIEDEPDIAACVCEYLRGEGFAALAVSDGVQALAHFWAGNRPGAIITDLMLPQLSGVELLSRLSEDPILCHIPVMVVSALPDLAVTAGLRPEQILMKPADLDDLGAFAARHCSSAGAENASFAVGSSSAA